MGRGRCIHGGLFPRALETRDTIDIVHRPRLTEDGMGLAAHPKVF